MTERALLAAIAAHPDEDTPRLVYADWLQENGDDARAEFIRVQCELATSNGWRPGAMFYEEERYQVLRARESHLHQCNAGRWLRVPCTKCDGRGWFHADKRYTNAAKTKCHPCDMTGDIGGLAPWPTRGSAEADMYPYLTIFRRGFPYEVRGCRLEDVFERHHKVTPWYPTDWIIRVLRAHPTIRRVPLVDRVPVLQDTSDGTCCWFAEEAVRNLEGFQDYPEANVPRIVLDAMKGGGVRSECGGYITFTTNELANDALAEAVADVCERHTNTEETAT